MSRPILLVIVVVILFTLIAIFGFLFASVSRRIRSKKRYDRLDAHKKALRPMLQAFLSSGAHRLDDFRASRDRIKWQAVEDLLFELIGKEEYREKVKEMFQQLGYVSYYEKRLKSRNVIERATAIDRLGGMRSEASVGHLVGMLDSKIPELIGGSIRAITRMRSVEGLGKLLPRLPDLEKNNLVAQKLVETSLRKFGPEGIPLILDYAKTCPHPEIVASLLEVLSNFEAPEAFPFVLAQLRHENPEVRAKAIKAFGKVDVGRASAYCGQLLLLLEDPVWFVKLQAAKTLGSMKYAEANAKLGLLLLDQKWQVRSAAAAALANIYEGAIDVFWTTLKQNDRYANESICEEIGKTGLVRRLIDNLDAPGTADYQKSRDILETMASLNFTSQLEEHLASETRPNIRAELGRILGGPSAEDEARSAE